MRGIGGGKCQRLPPEVAREVGYPAPQGSDTSLTVMNSKSNKDRWSWVVSEKERGINEAKRGGLSRSNAEEIFSLLLAKLAAQEREGRLPDVIHWGFIRYCLRQVKIDFLRKANAPIRGGDKEHVSLDFLAGECPTVEFSYPRDWKEAAIPMLDRIASQCSERQLILLKVMRRMILKGAAFDSWTEGFTAKERRLFMKNEISSGSEAYERFTRQVSRTFSEILKKIERIVGLN